MSSKKIRLATVAAALALTTAFAGGAAANDACPATNHAAFKQKLKQAVAAVGSNDMWGVLVNRAGAVCLVAFSGRRSTDQWQLSRVIAAAKAYTSNGLSVGSSFDTAALDPLVQPGQPLFGLAFGNPVDTAKAYAGPFWAWGTPGDPMVGKTVGGTITFAGGIATFGGGNVNGGLGISGDSVGEDQAVALALRTLLGLNP